MATGYFITGTDTGIGKTWISCLLLRAFAAQHKAVAGMKPIAAGCEGGQWEDVELLRTASNVSAATKLINPYAFHAPIAPHIAAAQEGVAIELPVIKTAYDELAKTADVIVVEGVGGFCVPINARQTTADLAQTLGLPVILVVGMRLGCINHALLTVQAIQQAGLTLTGWVANCLQPDTLVLDENIVALQQRIAAPLVAMVPYAKTLDMDALSRCIQLEKLSIRC